MEKYGFVYVWYDAWRKMYYIGCHWGREDDGYICSSTRMRKAYRRRPQDFKRRIVGRVVTSRTELLEEEYRWLSLVPDDQLGKKYYNLSKRHFGHWSSNEENLLSIKAKISDTVKQLHQDPEYREKFLEGRKKLPPQTEEHKRKISQALIGKPRSEETKRKISETNTGKVNGPLSEETKKKLSIALSGEKNPFYGKKHDPEKKKEMSRKASATLKGRHPSHATDAIAGSFWWNDGLINKRTRVAPGPDWVRGKLKRKT